MSRIRLWTKLDRPALWTAWREQFGSDTEAIATAIWIANRLVKGKARSTRRVFYSLKDEFIERHQCDLVEGQVARVEERICWNCDGEGCYRCNDGIYSSWTLYLHRFEIAGQSYAFHSYSVPSKLSDHPGEDCERYGGAFTPEELDDLSLPMSGLVKLLAYVAVTQWSMCWVAGAGCYERVTPPSPLS